jgi:hypothetical protein
VQKLDELRPPASTPKKRGGWLGIFCVAAVGLAVYLVLAFLTLNFIGPVLLVGGVLMLIVLFHYVVWGWWLSRVIRQVGDEEDDAADS